MGKGKEKEKEKEPEKGKKVVVIEEAKKKVEEILEEIEEEKDEGKEKDREAATAAAAEGVVVMRVSMDCEGCARKVRRALKGFQGVDEVNADCKTQTVVVRGRGAAAEPTKVAERIYKKCGKKAELIISPRPSPPLSPPPTASSAAPDKNKENNKSKEEVEPRVVVAVLNIHMHCEACAQEIKKKILRVKGVQEACPDLVASQVTVKGLFNQATLAEYVRKRTGKHVTVSAPPAPLPPPPQLADAPSAAQNHQDRNQETEDGGRGEDQGKKQKDKEKKNEKKSGDGEEAAAASTVVVAGPTAAAEAAVAGGGGGGKAANEHDHANSYYYFPRYPMEYYAYPPQIFSDENPNACVVM